MTSKKDSDALSANELADTRTAGAEDRTLLANERTFASWMRTVMAAIAIENNKENEKTTVNNNYS